MSDADPRNEFATLVSALHCHAQREKQRGRRRLPLASAANQAPLSAPPTPAPARSPVIQERAPARAAPTQSLPRSAALSTGSAASPSQLAAEVQSLEELRAMVANCQACALCETRKQTVFSDGSGRARVMFIGEAPGADEDDQGVPFVGRAGQLLTDIITKGMKLRRDEVYIANVLKCRPPGNRDPEPREKAQCTPFLDRQIELVRPAVIIPLGKHASQHILGCQDSMGRMRGRVHQLRGLQIVPTYHPAFLLRSPHMKRECWSDIQIAMGILAQAGA